MGLSVFMGWGWRGLSSFQVLHGLEGSLPCNLLLDGLAFEVFSLFGSEEPPDGEDADVDDKECEDDAAACLVGVDGGSPDAFDATAAWGCLYAI